MAVGAVAEHRAAVFAPPLSGVDGRSMSVSLSDILIGIIAAVLVIAAIPGCGVSL